MKSNNQGQNKYFDYFIDLSLQRASKLFVLSFEDNAVRI